MASKITKARIYIPSKESADNKEITTRTYYVDGTRYVVKCGVSVEVPLVIAQIAKQAGDIESFERV